MKESLVDRISHNNRTQKLVKNRVSTVHSPMEYSNIEPLCTHKTFTESMKAWQVPVVDRGADNAVDFKNILERFFTNYTIYYLPLAIDSSFLFV